MSACQAVGCGVGIGPGRFMCRPHWFGVPAPLRQQINACWRAFGRASGSARSERLLDHAEACDEAIRLTAEKEGKPAPSRADQRAPRLRLLRDMRESEAS